MFEKLTQINGFDTTDPNNAMQNNYAWSMAELGDYIYVGTGRNVPITALELLDNPVEIPEILRPPGEIDMRAEIWRYKKNGTEDWERVYKSDQPPIQGFRSMIQYTHSTDETALYAVGTAIGGELIILKSTNGTDWIELPTGIAERASSRSMVVFNDKLYMGIVRDEFTPGDKPTLLYVSTDPENEGWEFVDLGEATTDNPRGPIFDMIVFNDQLYLATSPPAGFEIWRTEVGEVAPDQWKLVVDKGGGDALNQFIFDSTVFQDYLYLGTAQIPFVSTDPSRPFTPPKGFDLIRIDAQDEWELVIGGEPVIPTEPVTGERREAISEYPSGFGNLSNAYAWQLESQGAQLFLGTFDWTVIVAQFLQEAQRLLPFELDNYLPVLLNWGEYLFDSSPIFSLIPVKDIVQLFAGSLPDLIQDNYGFDLWSTRDGLDWSLLTRNGLGNPYNYGARSLFSSSEDDLYLGTANPFQGLEVWVRSKNTADLLEGLGAFNSDLS